VDPLPTHSGCITWNLDRPEAVIGRCGVDLSSNAGSHIQAAASVRHRGRNFGTVRHGVGQRRQCGLDALHLGIVDKAGQHLLESRLHRARDNVLPAIGLQHLLADLCRALVVARHAGHLQEVGAVGLCLLLQDAVDTADQRDQVCDRGVSFGVRGQLAVFPSPFQFVDRRVLRFLLPVEQEHILEQR
jgi:hypothetical protein